MSTKYLAVGAMVPAAEYGAGALATQALTNMAYRETGLSMLRNGIDADKAVAAMVDSDENAETRQLGVVDRQGGSACWTGDECEEYAGEHYGPGFAIQGNLLAGPQVIDRMRRVWLASDATAPLAERLVEVLAAGDAAGGDRRGRQSAALYVVGAIGIRPETHVAVDLRVDDAADPVGELSRLLVLHRELADR